MDAVKQNPSKTSPAKDFIVIIFGWWWFQLENWNSNRWWAILLGMMGGLSLVVSVVSIATLFEYSVTYWGIPIYIATTVIFVVMVVFKLYNLFASWEE